MPVGRLAVFDDQGIRHDRAMVHLIRVVVSSSETVQANDSPSRARAEHIDSESDVCVHSRAALCIAFWRVADIAACAIMLFEKQAFVVSQPFLLPQLVLQSSAAGMPNRFMRQDLRHVERLRTESVEYGNGVMLTE